jgi:2-desacetyl-2-hydroxyethyl bacteriochlorophyllide A dehydrogenase
VTFPCITGYLPIGRVVVAGAKAAETYKPGDRINYMSANKPEGYGGNWMCGHLNPAVVNVDPSKLRIYNGSPYVERVPDALTAEAASLAGLAAVACRGIDMVTIQPGQKVLVFGQGVIGNAAAQICRILGAEVYTADIMDKRVEYSAKYAANRAMNSKTEDVKAIVKEWTGGQGADIIIDTTGNADMLNVEAPLLKTFGKIVMQGWYPPPSQVNFHLLHGRFASLLCPCGHHGEAVSRCMNWMAEKKLILEPLITHRYRPEDAPEAFEMIVERPDETMAIVFDWRKA